MIWADKLAAGGDHTEGGANDAPTQKVFVCHQPANEITVTP
jgi:hypothetical protein